MTIVKQIQAKTRFPYDRHPEPVEGGLRRKGSQLRKRLAKHIRQRRESVPSGACNPSEVSQ